MGGAGLKSPNRLASLAGGGSDHRVVPSPRTIENDHRSMIAVSRDFVGEDSWLTSSIIDYVFVRFARRYNGAHFLPASFAAFDLPRARNQVRLRNLAIYDVLGQRVDMSLEKPIIFCWNIRNRHWNLLRIVFKEERELQLFEPMG